MPTPIQVRFGGFSVGQLSPAWNLDRAPNVALPRRYSLRVDFSDPFTDGIAPTVLLALSGVDCGSGSNLKFSLEVKATNNRGFDAQIVAWSDTTLANVSAVYTAFA